MNEELPLLKKRFYLPFSKKLSSTVSKLSLTGKTLFYVLVLIFALSAFSMLSKVNSAFLVSVPKPGGTLTEGVIGTPRFINPLLATTDGDKDLAALVYSGLMRQMPNDTFIPDLAASYTISSNGLTYTVILKDNIFFHDGQPVTADDVEFTVHQVQNPAIKSNKQANWEGISVEKVDAKTIKFTLKQPYAPFIQNLTLGVLPKHLWGNVNAEEFPVNFLNSNPIGSGPYKILDITKNKNVPTSYELVAFDAFALGKPLIEKVVIKFYSSEKSLSDAYLSGDVDAINSISPNMAEMLEKRGARIEHVSLPRVFGVFFNDGSNPVLAEHAVRQALDLATNRDYIVNSVLRGYGRTLNGPVPQSFIDGLDTPISQIDEAVVIERLTQANALLEKEGWKLNASGIREKKLKTATTTLSFSISTSDSPELKEVADILKQEWRRIGVDVNIKIVEGGYLNQNIIRPRKYDALLFGQVINRDLDLFAFWHSSQRTDPGLNIALYSNKTVDTILEQLRVTSDKNIRSTEYKKFSSEIAKDIPALFLYTPDFIYVSPKNVKNFSISRVSTPSERFGDIFEWSINTEEVWKIFVK